MDTTIAISGMSCAHCVSAVRKALDAVSAVTVIDVAIGTATVQLSDSTTLETVEAAIAQAGYDVVKGRQLNVSATQSEA